MRCDIILASFLERSFLHSTLKSGFCIWSSYGEFWMTEPCNTSPRFSTALMMSAGLQNGRL